MHALQMKENLVSLAFLDVPQLVQTAYFWIPSLHKYNIDWLIALGIPENRIVYDPHIIAKVLIVPEMSMCGFNYYPHLIWIQKFFKSSPAELGKDHHLLLLVFLIRMIICYLFFASLCLLIFVYVYVIDIRQSERQRTIPTTILLIERTKHRTISNFPYMEKQVREFAEPKNISVVVHTDRQHRPIRDQIELFNTADIVIAPHGAGLLFTAFCPPRACVIEFIADHTWGEPPIYLYFAYGYGLSFINRNLDADRNVGSKDLFESIEKCVAASRYHNQSSF
jgi:hypothetical protein